MNAPKCRPSKPGSASQISTRGRRNGRRACTSGPPAFCAAAIFALVAELFSCVPHLPTLRRAIPKLFLMARVAGFQTFQIVFSHTTDRPREAHGIRQSGRAAWELAPCGEVLGTPLSLVGQMVEICDQAELRVSLNRTGRQDAERYIWALKYQPKGPI